MFSGTHSNHTHPTETPEADCFWHAIDSVFIPVFILLLTVLPASFKQHKQGGDAFLSLLPAQSKII